MFFFLSERETTCYFVGLGKITVDTPRGHRLLSGAPWNLSLSPLWQPLLIRVQGQKGEKASDVFSEAHRIVICRSVCACVDWRGRDICIAFEVLCWPGTRCWLCFSSNSLFCFQQSYAPAPHPMAPPSPSTNSSSNNSSNNSSGEQLSKTNLYIRGLPPGTTDQDLIKLCQP